MRKAFKIIGLVLGGLLALVVIAAATLTVYAGRQLNATAAVPVDMIDIPYGDPDAIARGDHLVNAVAGCGGCHGADLGGQVMVDGPPIGRVVASNLTDGGVGATFSDEDWVRAVRHGYRPDETMLNAMMPARLYTQMSDADLGAILAYIATLPPVTNDLPATEMAVPGRIMLVMLLGDSLPSRAIDHEADRPAAVSEEASAAYGAYLVTIATCQDCHGADLAGAQVDPAAPPAPNLTPGGELGGWTEADFITLIRTGTHPAGHQISDHMPWAYYSGMTDLELQAIWQYLSSLDPISSE